MWAEDERGSGKEERTLFRFPRSLAYSSKTSCSRGARDSVVKERSCVVEGGWVLAGGEAFMANWSDCAGFSDLEACGKCWFVRTMMFG